MTNAPASIDLTAKIHPTANIADGVTIGPWVYIGEYVTIAAGTRIDAHATILRHTSMGENNHIHSHAVIGGDPQDLSYRGEETWLTIGDGNIVREFVTLNRGSAKSGTTVIGHNNCFFSYSHVAHDACIGNEVLFVNNASIAGHVMVDDFAIIGAYAAVHQFTRIGAYSFLVHATQVANDIPPFMMVRGTPGVPVALNIIGLRRRGFSTDTISGLKKAYRLMYRQGLPLKDVKIGLDTLVTKTPEIRLIIDLMSTSKRGIVRKQVNRKEFAAAMEE